MAQPNGPQSEPPPNPRRSIDFSQNPDASFTSNQNNEGTGTAEPPSQSAIDDPDPDPDQHHGVPYEPLKPGAMRRISRSVVPGLPRTQTFKRQLSEQRCHLSPVEPDPEERRAVSMDRRSRAFGADTDNHAHGDKSSRDPEILDVSQKHLLSHIGSSLSVEPYEEEPLTERLSQAFDDRLEDLDNDVASQDDLSDSRSITSSQYDFDTMIYNELETTWILNLSMRYKDHSNREKFFVTYRENEHNWRRVTVTLDYRNAPEGSLEMELYHTKLQRDKSRKIYESIRESLPEIQFYGTVTNLKLETQDERLHVHVVEDANEIIHYPLVNQVAHLGCRRIREQDLVFDHHMSGFVYKVRVAGESLIKKEIPGPDTIEEFLYEINALNTLSYSENVINFYGLVVDEYDECVKGLLISYADGGALVDIIYDNCKDKSLGLQWSLKERWARQIVHGLADVHESGFVQGDFTLSNIVIDEKDDAKIIDINRRGCPVGWEPPEATPLIEAGHRISMYIGVKSDLYQLGMVLWALAVEEDEPEREGRPLTFGPKARVPDWYQQVTEICLDPDPRKRLQASMLLHLFPEEHPPPPRISIDDEKSAHSYLVQEFHPDGHPRFPPSDLPSTWWGTGRAYTPTGPPAYQSWHYAQRGRSPPSPLPSNFDDGCDSPQRFHSQSAWASNRDIRPSYSDVGDEVRLDGVAQQLTPCASAEIGPLLPSQDIEGSGVELHSQEPLHLPHPADEGADGRDVQDQITSSTTEPPVTTAHESKDDAAPVDVSKVEEQTPVAEDIPKDQVHAEQQVLDAVGAPNETSPNIQKVETPQDAPKHEHKNACTDPPTTTGPSLDVPTKETSPDVSTKEERCEDAPIVSDVSRKLTEAGGFQPNNAEITENIISLPEAKDSVDGLARSEQKDRTEDSGVPPSENNEDATKSIQTIPKDEEVPMEDKYQNLSESRETIPKDGKDAPSDAKDISTAAGDDTAETNMGPSSTAPNEDGSPVQKDVGTKSASPADAVAETVNPEQSSLDTDNDLPADDSPTKSPDITQAELGTFTNTHMDTPAPDLSSILTPQSDAAEVSSLEPNSITKSAQMSPEDQGGSGTKNAPEVPRNTEPDTEKKSDCIPRLIAFTGAAQTQSEAHSQPIPNDGNVEHTATTTNYDAAPRISPCEKSDAMRVQETLVGIGASHMTIDDNLWREKDLLDEDFHVVAPSDAIPTLIMTTDANT